jgi:23S rRNA (uridine2552-2'-O)-methyltransferase
MNKKGSMYDSEIPAMEGTPYFMMRQSRDPYVKLAKIQNYRCRSAFKLKEIDDEFGLITPGMRILDIGAAPGGWSQVVTERLGIGFG